jgi:hypothetical protein
VASGHLLSSHANRPSKSGVLRMTGDLHARSMIEVPIKPTSEWPVIGERRGDSAITDHLLQADFSVLTCSALVELHRIVDDRPNGRGNFTRTSAISISRTHAMRDGTLSTEIRNQRDSKSFKIFAAAGEPLSFG